MTLNIENLQRERPGDAEKIAAAGGVLSHGFDREGVDEALEILADVGGISDIYMRASERLYIKASKTLYEVPSKKLSNTEVEHFINEIAGENAATEILRSNALDSAYEIITSKNEKKRFRLSASAVSVPRGWAGISITLRTIASDVPTCDQLGVGSDILDYAHPKPGLVIVAGSTNEGKSTTLAAIMRHYLESPEKQGKVITLEAPIEYTYDRIQKLNTQIDQKEVPLHVGTFASGVENALRNSRDLLLIGESRDVETLEATCAAASTGHTVQTTVHAGSVDEVLQRIMATLKDIPTAQTNLINSSSMYVCQRLVKKQGGGLTALREILYFDNALKSRIATAHPKDYREIMRKEVENHGQSFAAAAANAHSDGLIDTHLLNMLTAEGKRANVAI